MTRLRLGLMAMLAWALTPLAFAFRLIIAGDLCLARNAIGAATSPSPDPLTMRRGAPNLGRSGPLHRPLLMSLKSSLADMGHVAALALLPLSFFRRRGGATLAC